MERPTAFYHENKRYEVVEVLDRWYEGGLNPKGLKLDYFKVRAGDGLEYVLRYNSLFDVWSLMVRRGD